MKKIYAIVFALLAVFVYTSCSDGNEESGVDAAVSSASLSEQDIEGVRSGFNALIDVSNDVDSSGYADILGTFIDKYSNYSFDSSHLSFRLVNTLLSDSLFSTDEYTLAILLKGTFSADTLTQKWKYTFSSGLRFIYPDKSGNRCSIDLSVIRDSSLFYNALEVTLARNDTVKSVVVLKHHYARITMSKRVITVTRSAYTTRPAQLSVVANNGSLDYFTLVYTTDSMNFSHGRSLLSNKFSFDTHFYINLHAAGSCSNFAMFLARVEETRLFKYNETEYKSCLDKANAYMPISLYRPDDQTRTMGSIKMHPYQRQVNGTQEWYACFCIVSDNGNAIPLHSGVDVTELPKSILKNFK